tara:strand:- start:1635 stop:1859 length:225 start_codon:yes stop_codon:yes gene_type:complete
MYPDATVAAAFPTRQRSRATATESTAAVATAVATAIATAIAAAAVTAAVTAAAASPPFRGWRSDGQRWRRAQLL